ncbi:MAG: hypothetical protein MMC33_010570 [Icmadophila ericetorum]|nr:hypothetical protein [Icmadophila ericetorum]
MFLIRRDPETNLLTAEIGLENYTVARLEAGLKIIRTRKQTKLLQPARDFLSKHELAYMLALQALESDSESKRDTLAEVQALDNEFHSKPYLHRNFTEDEFREHRAVLRFRERMLHANWGTYDRQRESEYQLRTSQEPVAKNLTEKLCPAYLDKDDDCINWEALGQLLEIKEKDMVQWRATREFDAMMYGIVKHIEQTCESFEFHPSLMLEALIAFDHTNGRVPNMVAGEISKCDWSSFGALVGYDVKDCGVIFPALWTRDYLQNMEKLRDSYVKVVNPIRPNHWQPTELALTRDLS